MDTVHDVKVVDAQCLCASLQRLARQCMGWGVQGAEVDVEVGVLRFWVDRYAMDGNGYHVGTEVFFGTLPLIDKRALNVLGGNWTCDYVVCPDALDVESVESAEKEHEYTELDAILFLKELGYGEKTILAQGQCGVSREDVLLEWAFDQGMGDGDYVQPDNDFAYQELAWALNQAMENVPEWTFYRMPEPDGSGLYPQWRLEFKDGEVVAVYELEEMK